MSKYIHTIDGRPAFFTGDQICFANFYGKPNKLCDSLKQIRKEQKLTKEFRESRGFEYQMDYGYFRYA